MSTDLYFMTRALELAKRGLYTVRHNPRVGCVIVKDNTIVGEGWHQSAGEAHAEIHALLQAKQQARGATCFITLEPCTHFGKTPPCVTALIEAGVARVVIASLDENIKVHGHGVAILKAAGIKVEVGLLEIEAQELNKGFFQRMLKHKPYVRVKMASSIDGRTALANSKSQWITGEAARQEVQYWRARSCAILTSSQTVLDDNPQLNVRDQSITKIKKFVQPLRVVVDTQLRTKPNAAIYKNPEETIVFTGNKTTISDEWLQDKIKLITLPLNKQHVDLMALMVQLNDLQMNEVLVEAGAQFVGALAEAGLVDEWLIYLAPKFLGQDARALVQLPMLTELSQAQQLEFVEYEKLGEDLRVIARPLTPTLSPATGER